MKKLIQTLALGAMFLIIGTTASYSQVQVTFRVNTATLTDTLSSTGFVQIRGAVKKSGDADFSEQTDYFGKTINWGDGSVKGEHVAGDYWQFKLTMNPGDTLKYKFYVGHDDGSPATNGNEQGWEKGGDNFFGLAADASGDYTTPVIYMNRTNPFDEPAKEDSVGVYFRVNVGRHIHDGNFDPEAGRVMVRGSLAPLTWGDDTGVQLHRETDASGQNAFYSGVGYFAKSDLAAQAPANQFAFKYFLEGGKIDGGWDSGSDNIINLSAGNDTTAYFKYFMNERVDAVSIGTAFTFAIQVGALEDLGYFNADVGDSVFVHGSTVGGWDNAAPEGSLRPKNGNPNGRMEFYDLGSAGQAWITTVSKNAIVGQTETFKYFIQFDQSRFDPNSPNYIPGIGADTGYEEPGEFGGGNRTYTVINAAQQDVVTPGQEIAYFNGIPREGFINADNTAGGAMKLKFSIDMNPAKTSTDVARPFNPASDSVFIVFETNYFAFTQDIRPGDQAVVGIVDDNDPTRNYRPSKAEVERLMFTDENGDGIYELEYDMVLPSLNDIGYRILYGTPLADRDNVVFHAGGTDPGRRYYQFIKPSLVGDKLQWPSTFEFPQVTWQATNLPYEKLPDYNAILSSDHDDFSDLPSGYALSQNYPNPFNPSTTINFTLPVTSEVQLTVFNTLGQKVFTLVNNQRYTPGSHTINFDASRLASGVYIYRLQAGDFRADRKMTLIK